jgi:transcriptional antiterminator RfaH
VVNTQPNREFVARHHLAAQGLDVFLPLLAKTTRHARQVRSIRAPLFPSYLFVELAIGRDRWRSVNGTVGVSRLIMGRDEPRPVPVGVVEQLIAIADRDDVLPFDDGLRVGQRARVLSGPFAGRIGSLTKATPAGRVQILMEIMGGQISVSTTREVLAPVA